MTGTIENPASCEQALVFMSRVSQIHTHYIGIYKKEGDLRLKSSRNRLLHKVYNIRVMDDWGMLHEFYDQESKGKHWYHERGISPIAFIVKIKRRLEDFGIHYQKTGKSIKRHEKGGWSWNEAIWEIPGKNFYFTMD